MGETIFKIAASYAIHKDRANLPEVFDCIQLAVGTAGGSELATHLVQATMDAHLTLGKDVIVAHTDVSNAFNTLDRAIAMDAVFKEHRVSSTWGCLHLAYSTPSPLLVLERGRVVATITSQQGVRQGDPLSSLAFALGIQAAYKSALPGRAPSSDSDRREAPRDHPTLVAVMDDLKIIGTPSSVFPALDRFAAALPSLNLQLNRGKTKIQWPFPTSDAASPPDQVIWETTRRGLTLVQGNAECFGASVGYDDNAARELAESVVRDTEELFSSLEPPQLTSKERSRLRIRSQAAFHILKLCARPRMGYVCRAMPPDLLRQAAGHFDDRTTSCFTSLADLLPLEQENSVTITSPLAEGGFGMRTQTSVLEAAYYSAAANAAPRIQAALAPLFGGVNPYTLGERAPLFVQRLEECRAALEHKGVAVAQYAAEEPPAFQSPQWATLPPSVDTVVEHYAEARKSPTFKLQRRITHEMERHDKAHRSENMTPRERARILSCADAQASIWLKSLPTDADTCLNDLEFSTACRLRAGQPLFTLSSTMPSACVCGVPLSPESINDHLFTCKLVSKHRKHNNLVKAVTSYIERATPFLVSLEPHLTADKRPRRGDFVVETGLHGAYIADAAIVHPLCDSYLRKAQLPLGAAKFRAACKSNAFQERAVQERGKKFVPFIAETFGALGVEALGFVSTIAATVDGASIFARELLRAIAFSIQKGNASIALEWTAMMSHHGLAQFDNGARRRSTTEPADGRLP